MDIRKYDFYAKVTDHLETRLTEHEQDHEICSKIHFFLGVSSTKDKELKTLEDFDRPIKHFKLSKRLSLNRTDNFLRLYYLCLGIAYSRKGNYKMTERCFLKVLPILRCQPDQKKTIILVHELIGLNYANKKLYSSAIHRLNIAIKMCSSEGLEIEVVKLRGWIAATLIKNHQTEQAIEQLIQIAPNPYDIDTSLFKKIYLIIAAAFLDKGNNSNAIFYFLKFLNFYEGRFTMFNERHHAHKTVAKCYIETQQWNLAIRHYKKALDLLMSVRPTNKREIQLLRCALAELYLMSGKSKLAIHYLETVCQNMQTETDLRAMLDLEDALAYQKLSQFYGMMAVVYNVTADYDQALRYSQISLETMEKVLPRDKVRIAHLHNSIGWFFYKTHDLDKALLYCTKSLDLCKTCMKEDDAKLAAIFHSLGAIWLALGNVVEAFTYCDKAKNILTTDIGISEYHNELFQIYELSGNIHKNRNETALALECYGISLNTLKKLPQYLYQKDKERLSELVQSIDEVEF